MTTMLKQLAAAFPDQICRIIACATMPLDVCHGGDASDALILAFPWGETKEGSNYWRALAVGAKAKSAPSVTVGETKAAPNFPPFLASGFEPIIATDLAGKAWRIDPHEGTLRPLTGG